MCFSRGSNKRMKDRLCVGLLRDCSYNFIWKCWEVCIYWERRCNSSTAENLRSSVSHENSSHHCKKLLEGGGSVFKVDPNYATILDLRFIHRTDLVVVSSAFFPLFAALDSFCSGLLKHPQPCQEMRIFKETVHVPPWWTFTMVSVQKAHCTTAAHWECCCSSNKNQDLPWIPSQSSWGLRSFTLAFVHLNVQYSSLHFNFLHSQCGYRYKYLFYATLNEI